MAKRHHINVPIAKELQIASRRLRVSEMITGGASRVETAKRLGVSRATIDRDVRFLEHEANRRRLKETVDKYGVNEEALDLIPTNNAEYREVVKTAVVELARSEKTMREIALTTGLSLQSVSNAVNAYLQEVGDFSGRTIDEWRSQQLLLIEEQKAKLVKDSYIEPVPKFNSKGEQSGWVITPSRAAQIRAQSTKVLLEVMYREAKLLGLDQQKQEVKITREIVHEWGGVDTTAWPTQDVVEGEWDAVS